MSELTNNRFILTGGPGTGKATVLDVMKARGFYCVPDTARAIIKARLDSGLPPRPELSAFATEIFKADVRNYKASPFE